MKTCSSSQSSTRGSVNAACGSAVARSSGSRVRWSSPIDRGRVSWATDMLGPLLEIVLRAGRSLTRSWSCAKSHKRSLLFVGVIRGALAALGVLPAEVLNAGDRGSAAAGGVGSAAVVVADER